MQIGVLSDIHIDINYSDRDEVTPAICSAVKRRSLDLMIIAGDVASDYKLVIGAMENIETTTGVPCLYIPGNHDIWTENYPDKTSWDIYELLKGFPRNLTKQSYEFAGDWVVIGDIGWYDFSFGDARYSFNDFSRMKYGDRVWQDSIKAVWDRTTLEMHNYFLHKLENQLKTCRAKNIILVTHVLPIQDFTVQPPDPMWEYMNAFLGSREYGELILNYPNIKYAISGHVHYRKRKLIAGTEFICNCLGYRNEWFENEDVSIEVERAMITIDIDV